MLLIDMEMPKGCNSCPIVRGCSKADFYRIEPRPKGCPLKELPKKESIYSEESMDDLYKKMVEYLEDHEIYNLIEIVASAIATKEQS